MDFLLGLQKALAQGITKEDYTDIWKKETELKICNSKIQKISSQGSTSDDMKSDMDCAEKNPLIPLLKQIAEKQDKIQHQQISIQQQLRHLQICHERDQQKLQQQFEEAQKGLSEKVLVMEASLANLQPAVEACVRQTAHSESLGIQEKCSVISQTFCNHILEEMRKITGGSKTVNKAEKSQIKAEKESQMLKKKTAKDVTARAHREDDTDVSTDLSFCSDDKSDIDEKMETLLMEIQPDADTDRSVSSALDEESSNSLKGSLRYELNTFLVNVQKNSC
ncbi:unnamed protein product [Candidula unifasciata]|uniref:Uncharacterized protein n=1 Tax=Candidula unifasciata TaxID=100452 RepID=A0A8S3ZFY3_9EUPU|nr:unnamed protein product [Candidula unifasciata]